MVSIKTSRVEDLHTIFDFEDIKKDFPFNIKVKTKNRAKKDIKFFGPGIYSIYDKFSSTMIYIGIFTPKRSVIHERYRKHIQTLTLRGNEVTFNKKISKDEFLNNILNKQLRLDLNRCPAFHEKLIQDRCVAHINKVNYAGLYWHDFSQWNPVHNCQSKTHERFSFQFDQFLSENMDKKSLQKVESNLISGFNPLTNSKHDPRIKAKYNSQDDLSARIKSIVLDDKF
ncbi:MAG: hypothetical protein GX043_06435 [Desulfovibrionales bacterium]|nr:hypothetical protein [Desulfovibrionales bacterium]